MAKSNVPNYVQSALNADRTQQVNTLSALIVYVFGEQKANRDTDGLGETLHKQAPHKSVKTWQNYLSAAGAVVSGQSVKLESLWAAATDPATIVPALVSWLEHELKTRKYQTSMEDVANWAKGRPSMAAQKKAKDAADKKAQEEQAKANAEAAAKAATQAQAEKEAADAIAAAAANAPKSDPVPNGDEEGTQATGYSPAIEPPAADSAPVFMASFARLPDGSIRFTQGEGLTRADLVTMALHLESLLETAPADVTPFPKLEEVAPV
jgi:hypothetical protein